MLPYLASARLAYAPIFCLRQERAGKVGRGHGRDREYAENKSASIGWSSRSSSREVSLESAEAGPPDKRIQSWSAKLRGGRGSTSTQMH